ncbi:uncharacterized protein ColSpa_12762 [Colletotrichum spaethianum]|uniref:Uncharacterized protein n=1 Tax=Colletotrichum spaethianum TaxID=700344 RepID=A0AA37PHS6_9PEZI|nr:uncharacterized protein ColSpa_12762 [Colletotrichum spaethianum]GKT52581.1 hypothetical protein ColSpa_12762 [Colletotrichum spaethianum]
MSQPHTPTATCGRKRSNSLPTPSPSPYTSPILKRAKIDAIQTKLPDQQAGSDEKEIATEAIPTEPQSSDKPQSSPGVLEPVQESVEVESWAETERAPEPKPRNPNRLSQIGISAAAVGAAAVAGIASVATVALGSKPKPVEEESGDIDDFTEEPEICTSSRVSIAGRSSPSFSESGKAVVVAPKLLQRTPSVHSARVVDVHGPKSPVTGSRTSSVDASDRSQPVNLSRASSVSRTTPPIIEETQKPKPAEIDIIIRSSSSTPRTRSPVEKSSRRQNTNESISEVDEDAEVRPTRQDKARTAAAASSPTPNSRFSQAPSSSARQLGSPRHDHTSSVTKVTILSDTHPNGHTVEDRLSSPRNRPQVTPSVPERNTGRQAHGTHSPAASIGVVTVERPAAGQDSPDRTRHLRTSGSSGSSSTGKIRAVRNSEDSKASGRADNLPRNFEELIQSDQTIQYTLTPENMRDLDHGH